MRESTNSGVRRRGGASPPPGIDSGRAYEHYGHYCSDAEESRRHNILRSRQPIVLVSGYTGAKKGES
jgi:hypothetical protein